VAVLGLVAVGGLWLLSRDRPQLQRLPDGTEMQLNGVIIATRAQYLHGRPVERLLRGLIPVQGIRIGDRSIPSTFGGSRLNSGQPRVLPPPTSIAWSSRRA
jgi:hypothetical protein